MAVGLLESTMKIGNPADKPLPLPAVAASTPAEAATGSTQALAPTAPAAAEASSHVELSSTAASLLSTGNSAEFDADKVARISSAIDGGTFKIDAGAIADKLISNAQELLGNVKA
jgi:negative regulator of flagellin synthesis FlgM